MKPGVDLNDQDVLAYEPFCDDTPVRVFRDKMVVVLKEHSCSIFLGHIHRRTRVRARTEQCEGKVMTFYFCRNCCHAMARASSGKDPGGCEIQERHSLGAERASEQHAH